MSEEGRKGLKVQAICMLIGLLLIFCFRVWEKSPSGRFYEGVEDMNHIEPHYDADGYFIMVSTKDGIVGTYWCSSPLKHYRCTVILKVDTPTVHTVDDIEHIGIDMELDDLKEIYETIPEGTPLLIY